MHVSIRSQLVQTEQNSSRMSVNEMFITYFENRLGSTNKVSKLVV